MWAPGISSIVSFPALLKPRWMATLYRKWSSTWTSWLAGRHHVFQNDLSWNTCSLSRLSFSHLPVHLSLILPSFSLAQHPLPLQGASFLEQSHSCLLGLPLRGAPILLVLQPHSPPSLSPPPLSQPQALCNQALSLCPTLVYQKSGPFSQPWMSESMHFEQATALGAKPSGMHDELWNLFRTSSESLVLPGHWTNEWEHVWQIRKSFLGNAWEEKSIICYCGKLKAWWKSFRDDLETRHFLLMV